MSNTHEKNSMQVEEMASLIGDAMKQVRENKMTTEEFRWWISLTDERRAKIMSRESSKCSESSQASKFCLLKDLGIVEWRPEYNLDQFKKDRKGELYSYNDNLTNANFPNPSRMPKVGDKFRIQLHEQVVDRTTSAECLKYLKAQRSAVLLGAHGLPMLYQKRHDLPKGKGHLSFDEKENLPFIGGYRGVPVLDAYGDGGFLLALSNFEGDSPRYSALVSFSDLESSES